MTKPILDDEPSLRQQFHDWLLTEGFAPQKTPPPGKSYSGSHVDFLWQCYLHATFAERNRRQPKG